MDERDPSDERDVPDEAGLPDDSSDPDRDRVPEEWELEGPAVSISLGDAVDVDPALLAAITGPDGLGGQALGALYGQDRAADILRPGPVLAALTEQAVTDVAALTDDQLIGALSAARRLENRAAYLQAVTVAEFGRRREAERAASTARRFPAGCRWGEFPADELAAEMVITQGQAASLMADAAHLSSRIPATLAGMAAGVIDWSRASIIAFYTASLGPADAARADEILAPLAPGLRTDQLARKAAALEMKLDPEAARARKEYARQTRQRVEVRREQSGNASLSGRELATADAMAAKANIDAIAARLRTAGLPGTLDHLRVLAFTDLTQGRDPLDRITPTTPTTMPTTTTPTPAPIPAQINLIVPVGTLLGWSSAPAQAAGWGLLDPDETRDIIQAASRHPRTRWCVTYTGPDGTATAHACATGRHPWTPPPPGPSPGQGTAPTHTQAARLAQLLRALNADPEPIARGACDHRHAEDRYTPSRKLKHLIRARTATCSAPGCNAQAIYCDAEHAIPYPRGRTDECNLHPVCRRHHRCKQAPGWHIKQPRPGVIHWTTPNGRIHLTAPTAYDV